MRWRTSHFGPILIPFFRSGSASFVLIIYVIFRILFLFFFWSLWEALLLPLESTGKRGDGLTSSSYQHNLYLAAPQSVCVSIHLIVVFIFLNKAPLRGRPSTVWVRFKKKEKKKKKREKKRKKKCLPLKYQIFKNKNNDYYLQWGHFFVWSNPFIIVFWFFFMIWWKGGSDNKKWRSWPDNEWHLA